MNTDKNLKEAKGGCAVERRVRRSQEIAIHNNKIPELINGKWATRIEKREVRVMARAEGYAMVRRKGCLPYCVQEKELEPCA